MNIRQPTILVCAAIAFVLAIAGGCSPDFHKADADKEVYKIINDKWHPSFGQKANYIIGDSNIAAPNDLRAEKIPTSPDKISLVQAVAIATANSRTYQTWKEDLYESALSLSDERHKYELQLFGTAGGNGTYINQAQGKNNEFSLNSNLGASQDTLIGDGIEIGTNLALSWARFLTGDPRTTLGSVFSATAAVPLLGAGAGKQKREQLIQTERDVVYTIRAFNRNRQDFVVDTINAYYGVLQTRDAVTNAQSNYRSVLESQDRLQMEAEAGRRTRIDVDEAYQNVLRAQANLVQAQQNYDSFLDNFKLRLAIPTDANIELDQNELVALKEMGITETTFALDEAIETALLRRLDLANSADKIDDYLRKAMLAAAGLGPQIDASANIFYTSPGQETDFQKLQFQQGTYQYGFNTDLPLDRKSQRNDYRRTLIALEQQKRQYAGDMDNVKLQVRDAYRRLQQTAEQFSIQQNSLQLATQRVESNKLLLDAGRVTVRIVLDSQNALLAAQNDLTTALVNHLNAKLSFYRDVGILQVKPDGMWAQSVPASGKSTNESKTSENSL
jgi:outer membrane protein TolC